MSESFQKFKEYNFYENQDWLSYVKNIYPRPNS